MNIFGNPSPWERSPFLGQAYMRQGCPGGMAYDRWWEVFGRDAGIPYERPPFWGEWGVHEGGGIIGASGKVGPFDTIEEAFSAAAEEAHKHGAELLPTNGFAQVIDSRGQGVGPIT